MTQKNEKPEEPKGEEREIPDVQEDFANLLKKYGKKPQLAANIAENVSYTGGPTVFEDARLLESRLRSWSSELPPVKRKQILEQWCAEKQIPLPKDVIEAAGRTPKEIREAEGEKGKVAEVKYVYDTDARQIRMAKSGEMGGTLTQARQLKEMAEKDREAGAESPFTMDAEGKWMLNPKARITGVEFMAMESIKRAQERGEPVDPLAKLGEAAETIKVYREIFGGGGGDSPAWTRDPVELIKTVQSLTPKSEAGAESPFTMDAEGKWMLNPKARITGVEFMAMESIKRAQERGEAVDPLAKLGEAAETIKVYREIFGGGGGDSPAWMRDPVELIKTVQSLTPKSEAGDAVTKELDEMKKALVDMKDERNREHLEAYQGQVRVLTDKVKELMDKVAEVGARASGKSEMDILSDITKEGIGFFKEELPALRKDIRDGIGSSKLPGPKTPGERAARKAGFSQAIAKDKAIESLGRRLFFNEG